MCGIAGFFDPSSSVERSMMRHQATQMADAIRHRGPDGSGVWIDSKAPVVLAHRRLAVIDLSPAGAQPMQSASGRYHIVFNGEIYNFRELTRELKQLGVSFRGHSDTEVMLAAIDTWGIETALQRFVGMFAFALWDSRDRQLHLVRDRLGEKPLYYGWAGGTFLFASELKAMRTHSNWQGSIDHSALTLLMRYGYIPAPHSIYKDIFKLPAGSVLSLDTTTCAINNQFSPHPDASGVTFCPRTYWSVRNAVVNGITNQISASEADTVEELRHLLSKATAQQMIADVPLGAFLSGGIDSATVVSLMQTQSTRPIKTFTIGFDEKAFDEAEDAKKIAMHLGTDHTELYVTAQEAMNVIPSLPDLYDEPFADSSQVPTFLVSKMARQQVTVCLSGDGGDELFGGYNRYIWTKKVWNSIGWLPQWARRIIATGLVSVSEDSWDKYYQMVSPLLPASAKQRLPGYKLHKLAGVVATENMMEMYRGLLSNCRDPAALVLEGSEPEGGFGDCEHLGGRHDVLHQLLFWDLASYLTNDNLVKLDRASMAVGLEARLPLLDHRVVEFACRVPSSMKIRAGRGKWLLRELLGSYVPSHLVERPKTGFSVPIAEWLRGQLRTWAEDLLAEERLRGDGVFDAGRVRKIWSEHLTAKRNWQSSLWAVLMFQAWADATRR